MKTIENKITNANNVLMLILISVLSIVSCSKDDGQKTAPEPEVSSAKQLTSFTFLLTNNAIDNNVVGVIDEENKTITATMPAGTDITGLLPEINISEAASINPNTVQNFSNPIPYTVTAEDGSTSIYTVTISLRLTQKEVLQAILDANPNNTFLKWDLPNTADTNLGTLDGITTNGEGVIIKLDLSYIKITAIPSEIENLIQLTFLGLAGSELSVIPSEIGNLINLEQLDLRLSNLTSIPAEIGNLSNLTQLLLGENQLNTFPPEIGNLTNLEKLSIDNNNFTSVPEVWNLTNLTMLNLDENKITSIPIEIRNLEKLTFLTLHNNELTSLPSEIWSLTNLTVLTLGGSNLTPISSEIGNLTKLTELFIENTNLSSVPPEIWNLTELTWLSLIRNNLTSIPTKIEKLTKLERLVLSNNKLTSIPSEIGNLTNLIELELENNPFALGIPQTVCDLETEGTTSIDIVPGVTCYEIFN